MQSFKDSADREWLIDLTYATIVRIHKETGFNLRTLVDGDEKSPLEPCFEFISDPIAFGPVLCAILRDQLVKKNVTEEAFLESLDGKAAEEAGLVFVRAYISFFHQGTKEALNKVMDVALKGRTTGTELAMKKLDELDLDKMFAERLAKSLNTTSGNAPASSVLTPDHSLSGSL